MNRPTLDQNIALKDFNDFYWLKKELILFCRQHTIPSSGGKLAIAARIRHYISTGIIVQPKSPSHRAVSTFDWSSEQLCSETKITDNYKNGQNARRFFLRAIGSHFSFNVIFMKWMKDNIGKTLGDAVIEWKRIDEMKKDKQYISEIAPQFEYNRYLRAFLNDNPHLTVKDAMKCWKLKRLRRGSREYDRKDLER